MSTRERLTSDFVLAMVIRLLLLGSLALYCAFLLAGCNRTPTVDSPLADSRQFPPTDLQSMTRNTVPQGGQYEKSDCAPRSLPE
jgi:hypothetical protein